MILKSIQAQNFLSFKDLNLNLENRGLLLLNGENFDNPALNNNGAGKSSIIEAIVYALYGRTLRGLKSDSVIHHKVGKDTSVILELEDDNGSQYKIARYRKHRINKNKSMLYRDGIDISPKSEIDFENYISNLLQADYNTFTASLLYSAESFKFANATDSDIKKTFDTMLGLDILSKSLEITKQKLRDKHLKLAELNNEVIFKENELKNLKEKIESLKASKTNYDKEISQQIETCNQSLIVLKEKLSLLNDELNELNETEILCKTNLKESEKNLLVKKNDLKQLSDLRDELQKVVNKKSKITELIQSHTADIKNCEFQITCNNKEKLSKKKKIDKLLLDCNEFDNKIGTPCKLCGQFLTKESLEPTRQEYNRQINDLQDEIKSLDKSISEITSNINKTQKTIQGLLNQVDELEKTQEEFESLLKSSKTLEEQKDKAERAVDNTKKLLYKIQSNIHIKDIEIKNTNQLINDTSNKVDVLHNSKNPFFDLIKNNESESEQLQINLNNLKIQLEEISKEKSDLEFWETAFSNQGIKSYILDDITPFLNRRLNKYLSKLTSGQIEAVFSTTTTLKSGEQREKFNLSIINNDGGEQYIANSSGEKKRIDLAINLALQDLIASRSTKKLNIAMFDEVFDSLDENGVDGVVSLLQELSGEKSTILVVSHNEYFKSFFTNVLTVVKRNGFSELKGE